MPENKYIITSDGELIHWGIKGMRWGVRKTQKWATSKHQPSSVRSSVLAGLYAATGNKRVGKALDKSNARDAQNWKRAKDEWSARQLYKDVKTAAKKQTSMGYDENVVQLRNKYKKEFAKGEKHAEQIWYKAFNNKLDYTKGTPEWQSMEHGKKYAKDMLKHYGDKKVNDWATASDYIAKTMNLYGSDKAFSRYEKEQLAREKANKR